MVLPSSKVSFIIQISYINAMIEWNGSGKYKLGSGRYPLMAKIPCLCTLLVPSGMKEGPKTNIVNYIHKHLCSYLIT